MYQFQVAAVCKLYRFLIAILRSICDNILAIGLMGQIVSETITNRD